MDQQESMNKKKSSWEKRVQYARARDILDVAQELGMDLVRSGRDYRWKEHDSMVISPDKNLWNWFRENKGGDVISLVETVSEVDFNQAIHFLNEGSFKEFAAVERIQEPFQYYLEPYEQTFTEARDYLRNQRGLSDETIDFFYSQGVLAQANAKLNGGIEPVLVFKSLNVSGEVIGANLQGIYENREKWPERGYAKRILRNSDGMTGLHVDIGQPKRLVFGESPIDLMSYYELHKGDLQDVRLVSMDGLKESVIGNHLTMLQSESSGRPIRWSREEIAKSLDVAIERGFFSDGKNQDLLTLAVDNDEAGRNFIRSLREKGAVITEALPELQAGKEKSDWNDILKNPPLDNSRLDAVSDKEIVEVSILQQEQRLLDEITADETYYLWHEMELIDLGATQEMIEEFHLGLEGVSYSKNGISLSVEESANDGASGYLSLEGHVLDLEGIESYMSNHEIVGTDRIVFLENLKAAIQETWNGVVNQYDAALEDFIQKNNLEKEQKEKSLENVQETNTGGELFNRNSSFLGEDSPGTAPKPVGIESQPIFHTNVLSYSTTDNGDMSNNVKEKTLEKSQESLNSNAGDSHRNPDSLGENSPRTASKPVGNKDQPDFPVITRLNFTTKGEYMSTIKKGYHVISTAELSRLNKFAPGLQATAQWYLEELSDSTITYLYRDGDQIGKLNLEFSDENFAHLTGILPKNVEIKQIVHDFANGNGDYGNIQVSHAIKDKSMVIPLLQDILSANAFIFNDLSEVAKFHRINLSQAVMTEDKDLLLAIRDIDGIGVPASLMRIKEKLSIELNGEEKVVLGVYRERGDEIEQLSINEEYIKDGGQEMLSIVKNKQYEESTDEQDVKETVGHSIDNVTDNVPDLQESFEISGAEKEFTSSRTEVRDHLAKRVEEIISNDRETNSSAESMSYKVEQQQGKDTVIHPKVRELIDQGQIKQWDRQPNLYFVKGLRKVALELTEDGKLQLSSLKRFGPRNDRDLSVVNEILDSLDDDFHQKDTNSIEPTSNNFDKQTLDTSSQAEVESFNYERADPYEISQHAFDLIRQYSQSPEELKEYVDFMSKFPELSPRNVALIHEQWRGANAVATYNQWKALGKQLGIRPEDVIQTKASYTNKKTGETKEVLHQNLSVKSGEKSKITLFRPLTVKMIPVFDENGRHLKNEKGNPKYKRLSEATPEEKKLVKEGRLHVKQFPERDPKTGGPKFTTYKVFELSQTTLKPDSYPKAMPNRHFNFNLDQVKTDEVLEGLCDYADKIGVEIKIDGAGTLDNAKGAFFPDRQLILLNPDNTPGEKIATTIHELAHATLHNPKLTDLYKEKIPTYQKELEAEMTSYLVSNYFGLDTSEKAIPYMASWTGKLEKMDDKQLADSLRRIHKTVVRIHKHVSQHMSRQPRQDLNQNQNLSYQIGKGPRR